MFFPFLPFPTLFFLHSSSSGRKTKQNDYIDRAELWGKVTHDISESTMRLAKTLLRYGLAQNQPPCEPRPAAVHLEEIVKVEKIGVTMRIAELYRMFPPKFEFLKAK